MRPRRVGAVSSDLTADMFGDECLHFFRFREEEIYMLMREFEVPQSFPYRYQRYVDGDGNMTWRVSKRCSGQKALLVTLARLGHAGTHTAIATMLGRSVHKEDVSEIFNAFLDWMDVRWGHCLFEWWRLCSRFEQYAVAYRARGAPDGVALWGVIDGTLKQSTRPGGGYTIQRVVYSGHKRKHGLKYLAVTTPDGLFAFFSGPWEGTRNDIRIFRESGFSNDLWSYWHRHRPASRYYVLGDDAFTTHPGLIVGFKGRGLTNQQHLFNTRVHSVRTHVEWAFGQLMAVFKLLAYTPFMKIRKSNIGGVFRIAAILFNARICMRGSETCSYFACPPPSLNEYLHFFR